MLEGKHITGLFRDKLKVQVAAQVYKRLLAVLASEKGTVSPFTKEEVEAIKDMLGDLIVQMMGQVLKTALEEGQGSLLKPIGLLLKMMGDRSGDSTQKTRSNPSP